MSVNMQRRNMDRRNAINRLRKKAWTITVRVADPNSHVDMMAVPALSTNHFFDEGKKEQFISEMLEKSGSSSVLIVEEEFHYYSVNCY